MNYKEHNKYRNSSLLLLAHGSLENELSSEPSFNLVNTMREKRIFHDVQCGYWKEEPSLRDALRMTETSRVYIVPNFISEGYFTKKLLPLELSGVENWHSLNSENKNIEIKFCKPIGSHPQMAKILHKNALKIIGAETPNNFSLIIAGHGTPLNQYSKKNIIEKAQEIKKLKPTFAQVLPSFLEEEPFIADWHKNTTKKNVVVVPFFIADGLHSYNDIPEIIGINNDNSNTNDIYNKTHIIKEKKVFYSRSIGATQGMDEIVMSLVQDYDKQENLLENPISRSQKKFANYTQRR